MENRPAAARCLFLARTVSRLTTLRAGEDKNIIITSRGVALGDRHINHIMFADDLVLLSSSPDELQKDLNSLAIYCDRNNLTVNTEKTQCLPFYRGRYDFIPNFFYKHNQLENVKEFKYLGITFTTQLSSSKHIDRIISKCNSRIGQLFYRLKIDHSNLDTALRIFQVYILPIIEYGMPVWMPKLCNSSRRQLNSLFSQFLKRFLCLPYCADNSLIHFTTGTFPLLNHLEHVHAKRFLSLRFPPTLSNLQIPAPPEINLPSSFNYEEIPTYFWLSEPLVGLPLNPDKKRALLYDRLDLVHHCLCKNKSFHSPSSVGGPTCLCIFCGKRADHDHHRECSYLVHLTPKQLLVKTGCAIPK